MSDEKTGMTRRGFLPATAAAFTIVPRHVLGAGYTAPSDKLNIAAVGVGGMGQNYVKGCASENIVAIADVDHVFAAPVFKTYPGAKVYKDFRVMFEKEKGIDAVIVGTPDHSHANERAIHLHGSGGDHRGMGEIGCYRQGSRGTRVDRPSGLAAGPGTARRQSDGARVARLGYLAGARAGAALSPAVPSV